MDEKTPKLAAHWIYRNRNTGYWTYLLLVAELSTHHEIKRLQLSQDDASSIFEALERLGFFHKMDGDFLTIGQAKIQKYRLDYSRLGDLRSYSQIPFYYHFPESSRYYFEKYWAWLIVCLALIATSFLQGFVGKLGEWIGSLFTG